MDTEGIYIRQTGIIDPEKLTKRIAIVGAGSIGGWTALCLGKLGCKDITVFDFDTVEIHNAGSQVFKSADDGMDKTQALEERLSFLLEENIKTVNLKMEGDAFKQLENFDIVIGAVDNMTTRQQLSKHLAGKNILYIDGRMAANAIEVYPVHMNNEDEHVFYKSTLFGDEDALPIPCSERAVVYNVFVVAGMMGDLIARDANGLDLPRELTIDLFNFTMFK